MTMEPAATRAMTQGDKGEPFRPKRNAIFERPRHMHSASAAAARVHACVFTTPPLFRAAPPGPQQLVPVGLCGHVGGSPTRA